MSHKYLIIIFFYKVVGLVSGGIVINRSYLV